MQGYIIGVDIGTGSAKAVAVNPKGKVIGNAQHSYSILKTEEAKEEQDPEILWNAFLYCIKELIGQLNYLPLSVSLSSAMHGIMAVNEEGEPLTNLITWSDQRSKGIAQKLRSATEGNTIYHATGTPIHAMSPLCKIIWWRENETEVFNKTHKFISIKEFIWFRLFNEYTIDHSIASATGLFNIDTLTWNKESLELAQISSKQLSTPVATDYYKSGILKQACQLSGLNSSVPVCIGASDGCLANLGTNSIKKGVAAITIGTSGAVRIASSLPIRNYRIMSFNYILDKENFICGGPINNGGNVMKWLLQNFLDKELSDADAYKELFDMIEPIPAGSDGLIFLPYIFAERAPVWDEKSSGVFMGIRNIHVKAHFVRAIIEGICYALNNVLELIENVTGKVNEIHASGGFIKSTDWVQLLADITGKTIVIVETDDASAIGAAFLAYKSLGIIKNYNEMDHESRLVIPCNANTCEYSKFFRIYKTLYPGLQESMHMLHETLN